MTPAQDRPPEALTGVAGLLVKRDPFTVFVEDAAPRLQRALVASFGPVDGRAVAVDALSWAWEHWVEVQAMSNPVGYLYRVGRTAARRLQSRPIPVQTTTGVSDEPLPFDPKLIAGLAALTLQQRTVVVLLHGYGWTLREVATVLDIAPSTVHDIATRGLTRLRRYMEVSHDRESR